MLVRIEKPITPCNRRVHRLLAFRQVARPGSREQDILGESPEQITADTLIVFGDRDPLYPLSLACELYAAIPRSHLWVLPNAGHSPVFGEAAPQFRDRTLSFLRGEWRG